jgi:hypothetical protein
MARGPPISRHATATGPGAASGGSGRRQSSFAPGSPSSSRARVGDALVAGRVGVDAILVPEPGVGGERAARRIQELDAGSAHASRTASFMARMRGEIARAIGSSASVGEREREHGGAHARTARGCGARPQRTRARRTRPEHVVRAGEDGGEIRPHRDRSRELVVTISRVVAPRAARFA